MIVRKKEYEFDPASLEDIGEKSFTAMQELAGSFTVNGAGVALSGIVEKNTGKVLKSINPLFTGHRIREVLSRKLALPVLVENRSRMAAYSEAYGGAADQEKDFALISLGRSIGAAFWLNGQLFTGQSEIRNLRLKKKKTFEEALSSAGSSSTAGDEIISNCADGLGQLLEIMGMERIVLSGRFADMGKDFAFQLERALNKEHICKVDMAKFGRFSAARGAAFLQGMDDEMIEQLNRMGTLLGVSYQIYDDCLDLTGTDDAAGKTLGTDNEKGKLTLPVFFLMESSSEDVAIYARNCVEKHEEIDYSRLRHTEAFAEAIRLSVEEGLMRNEEAREVLWMLPESPAREALAEMTYRLDEMLRDCCVD